MEVTGDDSEAGESAVKVPDRFFLENGGVKTRPRNELAGLELFDKAGAGGLGGLKPALRIESEMTSFEGAISE